MAAFIYPPLDLSENNIRLLQVKKGSWPNDVSCSLVEASTNQDEAVPYKALSYTWGDIEGNSKSHPYLPCVFVNDQKFEATPNLRLALSHIQDPKHDLMLWTDAICINQSDDREKGHQVNQMSRIYKNAEEVLVWLGPGSEEIGNLFGLINSIDQRATDLPVRTGTWVMHCSRIVANQYRSVRTSQNIEAMKRVLQRRWFRRVWVLQEVAMARTARVLCSSFSCPGRTFAAMRSILDIEIPSHVQAVLDLMPRIKSNNWWTSDRSLHRLLNTFSGSVATDARDQVYALLGMSQDACDSTRFYPSYEKGIVEVLQDTASFIVFGEIIDSTDEFPELMLVDLYVSREMLAARLLGELLCYMQGPKQSGYGIAIELIARANAAAFDTHQILRGLVHFSRSNMALSDLEIGKSWSLDLSVDEGRVKLRATTTDNLGDVISFTFP